ncbi:carbon storage regulator [Pseudomonas triclosanedens]|uniref:carbon storage regulator n=1 Tax=Pseudomonas triclosanedens TaxID=2961893 RepID=UPI0038B51B64
MGYLVLQRNEGEGVILTAKPDASDEELLRELREEGICVSVASIRGFSVRLAFEAPDSIRIMREELETD